LYGVLNNWFGIPVAWEYRHVGETAGRDLLTLVSEMSMGLLKKGEQRRVGGAAGSLVEPDTFSSEYPVLWSHLTQVEWSKDEPRETSSLLVFHQDGMLKGMIRDREAGLCLWMAAGSMTGLLGALEAGLCDPQAEWRVDRQAEGAKAKRVRKTTGGGNGQ